MHIILLLCNTEAGAMATAGSHTVMIPWRGALSRKRSTNLEIGMAIH